MLSAIREFDELGRNAFLEKYGFARARHYFVEHEGRRYDSKAIVGAAYGHEHPANGALRPHEFSGGEASVEPTLERLGFTVTVVDHSTIDKKPHFWWVNQGESYARSRKAEYLWAPMEDRAGRRPSHWQTMQGVSQGDVLLHYANGRVRAVSMAKGTAYACERPSEHDAPQWNNDGERIDLGMVDVDPPVALSEMPLNWRTGGPFRQDGAINQGYLFPVPEELIDRLRGGFPQVADALGKLSGLTFAPTAPVLPPVKPSPFTLNTLEDAVKEAKLQLPTSVLASLLAALESGKHVILTGPPGTAKTTLAEIVARAAAKAGRSNGYLMTTATADWTTYETIGGLKPTSTGGLEFADGHFLDAIRKNQWLLIDELNRSNFDRAFGQLFTVLSGQAVELPYERAGGLGRIAIVPVGAAAPVDSDVIEVSESWRVIATMNVFDKSLLFEMSFALMRRFAFIEIPAPDESVFADLIAKAASPDPVAADLAQRLLAVRRHKDLGPALFIDIARYLRERRLVGPSDDGLLLFEAFYSFLLPQFEGIDEVDGQRLYERVLTLVGQSNRERLRLTLNAVLGLSIAAARVSGEASDLEEPLDPDTELDSEAGAENDL